MRHISYLRHILRHIYKDIQQRHDGKAAKDNDGVFGHATFDVSAKLRHARGFLRQSGQK